MALFECKLSVSELKTELSYLALDYRASKTFLSKRLLEAVKTSGDEEETNASVGNTSAVQDGPGIPASGAINGECNSHFDLDLANGSFSLVAEITTPKLNNELSKIWSEISSLHGIQFYIEE